MGRITIAAFRPHAGKADDVRRVLEDRLVLLRGLGMVTDRAAVTMQSRDGVILQVSEWVDDDAIRRAHETPEVLALWQRFAACCDYVKLDSTPESHDDFATYEALDASP